VNTECDQHGAMSDLINAHLSHLRASGQSDYTIRTRASVLRRLHHELPYGIGFAEIWQIEEWLSHYAGWSRYTYDGHIRAFYTSVDGVHLDCSAYLATPRPKIPGCVPDPVTDDELRTALERSDARWRLAILLAALAGLRVNEIAGLHREDVNQARVFVRLGKGGRQGSVPTHPELWALIRNHGPGPLVLTAAGLPTTGRYLSTVARRHFDRIEMPTVHMHRFRHWFGTSMLNTGTNVRVVQELLRHRSLASTMIYTAVAGEQRRAAINALPIGSELEPGSSRLEP